MMEGQPTPPAGPDWADIQEQIRCPLCEYDLRMLTVPRCPECGYRFEWDELLDPSRRRHPYIFEHHPECNFISFRRTLLHGFSPRRFWTSLHPAQPSSVRRLVLYWSVVAVIYAVPIVAEFAAEIVGAVQIVKADRAWALAYYSKPSNKDRLQDQIEEFGSVQAYVDYHWPIPNSPARIWEFMWFTPFPIVMMACLVFPLLYSWLTFVALLVFRFSMRRARIKPMHVLRCVIYSADVGVWMGVFVTLAALGTLVTYGTLSMGSTGYYVCLGFCVVMTLFAVCRLYVAYRYYLRFDHPLATVLASQVIVLLLGANLIVALIYWF